jgi:hypothetical protein
MRLRHLAILSRFEAHRKLACKGGIKNGVAEFRCASKRNAQLATQPGNAQQRFIEARN